MKIIYRAGTESGPSFEGMNDDEVWLTNNPALYYPLGKKVPNTRSRPTVCLWKATWTKIPKDLTIEDHPSFTGICVIKDPKKKGLEYIKHRLKALRWEPCVVPECHPGMSAMNFSVVVLAVQQYITNNPPRTPEAYNFQAELKAASYWRWLKEEEIIDIEQVKFVDGPHNNSRILTAVKTTLKTWISDLTEFKKLSIAKSQRDHKDSDSSSDDEEYISELEGDIFSLQMYYNGALEESDDDSSTAESVATKSTDSPRRKRTRGTDDFFRPTKKISSNQRVPCAQLIAFVPGFRGNYIFLA